MEEKLTEQILEALSDLYEEKNKIHAMFDKLPIPKISMEVIEALDKFPILQFNNGYPESD
jgi:hypothetical protein